MWQRWCLRSMQCVRESLLFQSTRGPSPDRQPRGPLQRKKKGSAEDLNHSCLSGKRILTSPKWGSDERGRIVTCALSVTDTHCISIPGLVWTALARSAICSSAPAFHPRQSLSKYLSLLTKTKDISRALILNGRWTEQKWVFPHWKKVNWWVNNTPGPGLVEHDFCKR